MAGIPEIVVQLRLDDSGMVVGVSRVGSSLRQLQSQMGQTAASVKKLEDAHVGLGQRFHNVIATMGYMRFAAMDLNDLFLRLPVSILKSAGELERLQTLMKGMSKEFTDVKKAAEGMKDFNFVTNFAKTAPFDIGALSDSFVKLKTAGLTPADGSMKALVDSVARFGGTSETLKRASIAIQQMAGKGVISMEELRQQLGEAVPSAMQSMADGMRVTMAELAKIVQTGTLEAGPALSKMFLRMQIENSGAAEAMMKTWGGKLSQLKTEWELTALYVTEHGFGDAAKSSLDAIKSALQSDDFKRFAGNAGASMGRLVNDVVSLVGTMVKYREEIKLGAEAWIAYKLVFSAIGPMGNLLAASSARRVAGLRAEWVEIKRVASIERESILQKVDNVKYREAELASILAGHRTELASLQARNAGIVASQAAVRAAMAVGAPVSIPGMVNPQNGAVGGAWLRTSNVELAANAAAQAALTKEIAATTAARNAAAVAATAKIGILRNLTTGLLASNIATRAAAAGTAILGGAISMLGGPIGVIITAVMAAAWAYNKLAYSAEDAADRMRRAKDGMASKSDTYDAKQEYGAAILNARSARKAVNDPTTMLGFKKSREQVDADIANLNVAEKRLADARSTVALVKKSLYETEIRNQVEDIRRGTLDLTKTTEADTNVQLVQMDEENKKKLAKLKSGSEEWIKARDAGLLAQEQQLVKGQTKLIALEKISQANARRALTNPGISQEQKDVSLQVLKESDAKIKEYQDKKDAAIAAINAKTPHKDMNASGKGRTRIESLIEKLKEDKAKLDAEIPGLLSSLGKVDDVEAAMAQFEAKVRGGGLNEYTKDKKSGKMVSVAPSQKAIDEARELARAVAERTVLEKDLTKINATIIGDQAEWENATALLANPLVEVDGSKATAFRKMVDKLKKNPKELNDLAVEIGKTPAQIDKILKDGQSHAQDIDLAASFKPAIDKMLAIEPDFKKAAAAMLNPFGIPDSKAEDDFEKMISKIRKTPEDLAKMTDAQRLAVTNMLAMIDQGRAKVATIDTAARYVQLANDNRAGNIALIQDDRERVRQQMQLDNDLADLVAANFRKKVAAAGASNIDLEKLGQQEADAARIRSEKMRFATMSPLERMAEDWQKSLNAMDDASVRWADGIVDVFITSTKTGKLEFKDLVQSVLDDIFKIEAKRALGDPLRDLIKGGTDWLGSKVKDLSNNGRTGGSTPATDVTSQAAQLDQLTDLTNGAGAASLALNDMRNSGVEAATQALVASLPTEALKLSADQAFTVGLTTATGALAAFSAALAASAASSGAEGLVQLGSFFADGGVMTNMGPVALRKYAAGGIARSPQLALYGEAGPEAYVPLPDGRSIPVTMSGQGGGGANVVVNVINQSGTPVGAQQGQPRFDGKQMILDVVLTAASTPGGFRDGLKGAMK